MSTKIGRNDLCPCGSGKRFKKCCRNMTNLAKLKAWNKCLYEVMVKEARKKEPERFAHEQRFTAYHEAGHALMEMLLYCDLKRVSIIPFFSSWEEIEKAHTDVQNGKGWSSAGGVCVGIKHTAEEIAEDGVLYSVKQLAILFAGKAAGDLFCTCAMHAGGDSRDQEEITFLTANVRDEHKLRFALAVASLLKRHRPQLDAIVEALIEHETLSGKKVMEVMLASGWNPETDADPDQFYREALGLDLRAAA